MRRWKLVAAGAAALVAVGGGAAIAATQFDSPSARSQAIIADAAGQLGVTPDKLSAALKQAVENQIQAEVTSGQLTQAQADAMKKRVESGDYPLMGGFGFRDGFGHGGGFGHGFGPGFGLFGELSAAATYLGVTVDSLRTDLAGGKTLAQVAADQKKSVDGLVSALLDSAKSKLDAAVKAGRLTQAQEDSILSNMKQQVTDMVNGKRPSLGPSGPSGPSGPQGVLPFNGPMGRGGGMHGHGSFGFRGGRGGGQASPATFASPTAA